MKTFYGISPRYAPHLAEGYAVIAENCDLSSGKLRPLKGNELVKQGSYEQIVKFSGAWITGDKNYIYWPIGQHKILFYLDGGVLKKNINGFQADVGQDPPTAPEVFDAAVTGVLKDTFQYIITWSRKVGDYVDESGPSLPSPERAVNLSQITIKRPYGYDSYVTAWNIYRIGQESGEFQFVASVPIGTATYTDNIPTLDLSASPTTWYTSVQGNEITFDKPPILTGFTGPHAGMLFGWKDSTLYWSDPGTPDAWPSYYFVNFPSKIISAQMYSGALAVFTENGPYRVDGTNPELLQQTEALGVEPCICPNVTRTSKGIYFMSDSGLTLFNNFDSVVISDSMFTEQWFKENINSKTAILAENDNIVYIFHSTGTLYFDYKVGQWATMPFKALGVWKDASTGDLYASDIMGIWKISTGTDSVLTWKSGDIYAGIKDVPWKDIEVVGTGEITLTIWIDDKAVSVKTLTFDSLYRNRTLGLPQEFQGRRLQLQFSGSGTVEEVIPRI